MIGPYKRWDFRPRYHLANALMRFSLAILPAGRVRDEIKAMLAAYREGVEAAVFLHAMNKLNFFTAEAGPDDLVSTVTAARQGRFKGESIH